MPIDATLHQELLLVLDQEFYRTQEKYLHGSAMAEMLKYHYETGGKRLRPFLVWAVLQELGSKEDWKKNSLPFALAVELIHNATLIHDDIQDGDSYRRGKPTLWKKYSMAQAINCGDAWFFLSLLHAQDAELAPQLQLDLQRLVQVGTLSVIEGQAQEFLLKEKFLRGEMPSLTEYLQMVNGKTSPLFSIPLVGAAKLGKAPEKILRSLERQSVLLGEAFQIQDDLVDIWGQKGRERAGSDIAEGKLSFPLVLLLPKLSGAEKQKVWDLIVKDRNATTDEDIAYVIALYERCEVREEALDRFQKIVSELKTHQELPKLNQYLSRWLEDSVAKISRSLGGISN